MILFYHLINLELNIWFLISPSRYANYLANWYATKQGAMAEGCYYSGQTISNLYPANSQPQWRLQECHLLSKLIWVSKLWERGNKFVSSSIRKNVEIGIPY